MAQAALALRGVAAGLDRAGPTDRLQPERDSGPGSPWATVQVGRHGRTVAEVAVDLGCDWRTVMNAIVLYGQPLIGDPHRISAVWAVGWTICGR